MHVLVIGAAGMVGRKLVEALVAKGEINGKLVERLTRVDIVKPAGGEFKGGIELHFYPGPRQLKVYVLRDGALVRLDGYLDPAQARAALGLDVP